MAGSLLAEGGQSEEDNRLVSRMLSDMGADNTTAWRYKTLAKLNPYMANNPSALTALASSNLSEKDLFTNASALYGMYSTNSLMQTLPNYLPSEQRAIFGSLAPQSQLALNTMGYQVPVNDAASDSFWQQLGPVSSGIKFVMGGAGKVMAAPVISPALRALTWASDMVAGKPYRTISQLDGTTQALSVVGGAATAAAALALIPFTGGATASLAIGGASFALGALATSALVETARGNVDVWATAWKNAYNGERMFRNDAIKRATKILDNPQLIGLAQQVALESLYPNQMIDLAREIAGNRGSTEFAVQFEQVKKIAARYYDPTDPQYSRMVDAIQQLLNIEPFQNAVRELELGKVSLGRDIARLVSEPGTTGYNFLSGGIDAASQWFLDPFNAAQAINRSVKVARYGIEFSKTGSQADRFRRVAEQPAVMRRFDEIGKAISSRSYNRLRRFAPDMTALYPYLDQHRLAMIKNGTWDAGHVMTGQNVVDFIAGQDQLSTILRGFGVVPGTNFTILKSMNRGQYLARTMFGGARDFISGLADANILARTDDILNPSVFKRVSSKAESLAENINANLIDVTEDEIQAIQKLFNIDDANVARSVAYAYKNPHLHAVLGFDDSTSLINAQAQGLVAQLASDTDLAYKFGRIIGDNTFGRMFFGRPATTLDNMMRRVPPGGINLTGYNVADDFAQFVDLFKAANIPSFVRNVYVQGMLEGTPASRLLLSSSMIDTFGTIAGFKYTKAGQDLLSKYLEKNKQLYSFARNGDRELFEGSGIFESTGVRPVADQAVIFSIPDLNEIRRATRQALLARSFYGISDNVVVNGFLSKIWKPAVLLRLGFIPRQVSEELLNFVARAGHGHLTQEFGARIVGRTWEYDQLVQRADEAAAAGRQPVFTKAEQYLLSTRGDVAFPFRTVARVLDRSKAKGSVLNTQLYRYTTWINTHLTRGFFADTALAKRAESSRNLVSTFGKFGTTSSAAKENLRRHFAALAYGNPISMRRMIIGGINEDVLRAAFHWQKGHMRAIMEVAGSTNTAPWAEDVNGENILKRVLETSDGEDIPLINVRGERVYVGRNDPNLNAQPHESAVLDRRQEMMADPVIWEATKPLRRYYNADIQAALPPDLLKEFFNTLLPRLEDSILFDGFYLFNVGTPSRQMFDAWIERLITESNPGVKVHKSFQKLKDAQYQFAKNLKDKYPGARMPTFADVVDEYRTSFDDMFRRGNFASNKWDRNVLLPGATQAMLDASRMLDDVPEFARDWLMQFIVDHSDELVRSSPMKNALLYSPDYRLSYTNNYVYRGVSDPAQVAVNPDGSLRLFFQHQGHFGENATAISFTKSFNQASRYSGLVQQGLADAQEGSVLLSIDFDELKSVMNMNWDEQLPVLAYSGSQEFIRETNLDRGLAIQQTQRGLYGGTGHDSAAEIAAWNKLDLPYIDIPNGKWTATRSNPDATVPLTDFERQFFEDDSIPLSVPPSPFITDTNNLNTAIINNAVHELNSGDWDQFLKTNRNYIDDAENTQKAFLVDTRMIDLSPASERSFENLNGNVETQVMQMFYIDGSQFRSLLPEIDAKNIAIAIDQRQPLVFDNEQIAQSVINEINSILENGGVPTRLHVKQISMPDGTISMSHDNFIDESFMVSFKEAQQHQVDLLEKSNEIQHDVWIVHSEEVVPRLITSTSSNDFLNIVEDMRSAGLVSFDDDVFSSIKNAVNEVDRTWSDVAGMWQDSSVTDQALRYVLTDIYVETFRTKLQVLGPDALGLKFDDDLLMGFRIDKELARSLVSDVKKKLPEIDFSDLFEYIDNTERLFAQDVVMRLQMLLEAPKGQLEDAFYWWKPITTSRGTGSIATPDFHKIPFGPNDHKFFESFSGFDLNGNGDLFYAYPWDFIDDLSNSASQYDIADRMLGYIEQNIRSGRRTFWHVRDDANARPIFRRGSNGEAIAVQPGERITTDEIFYNDPKMGKKNVVTYKDRNYFTNDEVKYEGNDEIMWSVLAPVMLDQAMQNNGRALHKSTNPIDVYHDVPSGSPVRTSKVNIDRQRVPYANEDHVRATPMGELPDIEIGKLYEGRKANPWDKTVQFGFNKVISPAMDALSRKPIAFHAYVNAFIRNQNHLDWLITNSPEEIAAAGVIKKLLSRQMFTDANNSQALTRWIEFGRTAGAIHGLEGVENWTDLQSLSFIRSFAIEGTTDDLFDAVRANMPTDQKGRALVRFAEANRSKMHLAISPLTTPREFMTYWNAIEAGTFAGNDDIRKFYNDMNQFLNDEERQILATYADRINSVSNQAADYAAEHAVRDIVPFLDSHEIRSQFADHAKNLLPFYYAEQNFMTRWAKTFAQDGVVGALGEMRKMQLRYMGLKSVGVIRTDANGKDYFVYPGSELLYEAVEKIFPGAMMPLRSMLETPTDRIIPGFSPQFGTPSVSPLVGIPMDFFSAIFPEAQPFERALLGDFGTGRTIVQQIVPATLLNTYEALNTYFDNDELDPRNPRVASAMMSAIAHLEAAGQGLPDNATPGQVEEFIRQVRDHSRIIVVTQALAGWFIPGPAQTLDLPEGGSTSVDFLFGKKIEDPASVFSSAYFDLVKELGIEQGTVRFLELNPQSTVRDIFNPEAYTISRTTSAGGAPLPSTEDGIQFYTDNQQLLDQYPDAGAWLLPMDIMTDGERSQYAYDVEIINGLRNRRSPLEFTEAMMYREGSLIYFERRSAYMAAYNQLKQQGRDASAKELNNAWSVWAETFKATHPIFAQTLQEGAARDRRQRVLTQMRYLLNDPLAPKASHFDSLKLLMDAFDEFSTARSFYAQDNTARGRERVNAIKENFAEWATQFVADNPMVAPFYLSIIQPEAGLE